MVEEFIGGPAKDDSQQAADKELPCEATFDAKEEAKDGGSANSIKPLVDEAETIRDGQESVILDQSEVDAASRILEPQRQKTFGRVLSFKNMKTTMVHDGAMSYSHVPTLDKQESSKKESEEEPSAGQQDEEEGMELPQLDEDSA